MSDLERALRDLEIATAALAKMPLEDADGADAVVARRAKAIARLVELKDAVLQLSAEQQAEIVQRMRYASGGGELAQLRMAGSQRKAVADWSKWHRISQSLAAGIPVETKVDYEG